MTDTVQNPRDSTNSVADPTAPDHEFKVEDETVKLDNEDVISSSDTQPSFNGRLNMADFAFASEVSIKREFSAAPRRSPRISVQEDSIAAAPTLKRKPSTRTGRTSVSPAKRSRKTSGYAAPSAYAHLKPLRDVIEPNLICLFVGLNPGVQTSIQGHAYAHPSNLFWKLLHSSGCTTRRCQPSEDRDLPRLFELGNTNIVSRPTKNGSELSKSEMDESVDVLEEKVRKWRPESVCLVGKSIWESIWRARHGRSMKKEEFKYGWQDEGENMGRTEGNGHIKVESQNQDDMPGNSTDGADWKGARVFVATSTSGLAASLPLAEKERIWRELGAWVEQRRLERSCA
jgi:mismatch-specific thymine-DNA glycosylase